MIAMLGEDMLTDMGHEVVGPAMRLETALKLAREADIDLAVPDENLGEVRSFAGRDPSRAGDPVHLREGYGRKELDDLHDQIVVIDKPFKAKVLERTMPALAA